MSSKPRREKEPSEGPGPYWDTPAGRLFARDGWTEWGGELILAAGETDGGCPFGLSFEEWLRIEDREGRRRLAMKGRKSKDHGALEVELEDLAIALESGDSGMTHHLDLKTGEVCIFFEDDAMNEDEAFLEAMETDPDRYLWITPMESHESFQIMKDFVEGLPEGRPRESLERALNQRKPFRHFKDALLDYPDLRERWFAFHDLCVRDMALDWLAKEVPGARGK